MHAYKRQNHEKCLKHTLSMFTEVEHKKSAYSAHFKTEIVLASFSHFLKVLSEKKVKLVFNRGS